MQIRAVGESLSVERSADAVPTAPRNNGAIEGESVLEAQ
jgi:hypothetical protein